MNIFDFLSSDAYISVNKKLIGLLGLQETALYCELISRYRYFRDKNMVDDEGWFFNTIEDLEGALNLSAYVQRNIICKLSKLGLLEMKNKGIPCKRYFKLNNDSNQIQAILEQLQSTKGLKSSYLETSQLESEKLHNCMSRNFTTGNAETSQLYNKKNVITKTNKKNLIISGEKKSKNESDEEKLERKVRDRELKEYFMENIWNRYPIQHRVGEKLCFSRFKSAIKNGVSKEEVMEGFNTYLKVIEINKKKGSEQYIKRLDNWFAAESWKNPNRYMQSQMESTMEKQVKNKYPDHEMAKCVWNKN
jgi:predicted DNA binding CopG/RHH family protein